MKQLTYNGQPQAEELLKDALNQLGLDIAALPMAEWIQAVILGGGYGRGEGGATADGALYNDVDFFVITDLKGNDLALLQKELAKFSEKYQQIIKIDVDFFCLSLNSLQATAKTLMIQELLAGHEVIYGSESVLNTVPHLGWRELPWSEAARLMLNRGTGILLAAEKLNSGAVLNEEDLTFIRRNLHKAALGCGDALLLVKHNYRQTGHERSKAILSANYMPRLAEAYLAALEFKYTPTVLQNEDLTAFHQSILQLWNSSLAAICFTLTGKQNNRPEVNAANIIAVPQQLPLKRKIKDFLLSMRYAGELPQLRPFCVNPRLKLLVGLAKLLNAVPPADSATYIKLWQRFN